MMLTNENAHRGMAGAGGNERGQRFISYPHYTRFWAWMQSGFSRLIMRLAVLFVDIAEALAGTATRWECNL